MHPWHVINMLIWQPGSRWKKLNDDAIRIYKQIPLQKPNSLDCLLHPNCVTVFGMQLEDIFLGKSRPSKINGASFSHQLLALPAFSLKLSIPPPKVDSMSACRPDSLNVKDILHTSLTNIVLWNSLCHFFPSCQMEWQ